MATTTKGGRGGLGEVLLDRKVLTAKQLEQALVKQKESGRGLAPVLVDMGLATEEDIVRAVADHEGVRFVDLTEVEPDPSAATLIDGMVARKHAVIPVGFEGDRVVLAMANPRNGEALEEVAIVTGLVV